jgi:hypothetical protein
VSYLPTSTRGQTHRTYVSTLQAHGVQSCAITSIGTGFPSILNTNRMVVNLSRWQRDCEYRN